MTGENYMKKLAEKQTQIKELVPSRLTKEEITTIRIHMNAIKETLCNQHRWKEADVYQQIIDKLDIMMDSNSLDVIIKRKDHGTD